MNETISTKALVSRKSHKCDWCFLTIATGETYNRSAVAGDGSVWTWKSHPECDAEIATMEDYDGEGFPQHALINDLDSQSAAWQEWYTKRHTGEEVA